MVVPLLPGKWRAQEFPGTSPCLFQRCFRRCLGGGVQHIIENLPEFFQARGRNDDCIAPPVNILSDPQEPAPGVLLQRKHKCLPLNLNLVALQRVFGYGRFMSRMP